MIRMVPEMKGLTICLAVLFFASTTMGQVKYSVYENSRFGYSIEYPSTLTMQPPPENGDGRIFLSKDVELRVWANYNALFRSVQEEFDETLKSYGDAVSYKRKIADSFVVSGT